MVKFLRALVCALLTVVALVAAAPAASAAPPSAAWSGNAVGDVTNVGLDLVAGVDLANVRLTNSEVTVNSQATPESSSVSRNLAALVGPLGVAVDDNEQTAPPDNTTPETGSLATVAALGIDGGAVTFSNLARYLGDDSCLPAATPYAVSTTTTAGAEVTPDGLVNVLTTGEGSVTTTTGLTSTGGNGFNRQAESEAVGTVSDVSLLGGAVDVEVAGAATLNVTANGEDGGADVDYTAPLVTVTVAGVPTVVELGTDDTFTVPDVGSVNVEVNQPDSTLDPAGRTATAEVAVVTLTVTVAPLGVTAATATIDLLPLAVSAAVPAGGIDCPPPAPVITEPDDGETINDRTPTYTGTGVPGAIITLTVDDEVIEDTEIEVDEDGNWSFTQPTNLADGPHTVSAIQTLNGTASVSSAENTFVVDATAPAAPVITAPEDGSTTNDPTPTITGTGEPGAEVTVEIDGDEVGTVTVDGDGNWTLPLTEPLDEGEHTVTATQTDEAGNVSPADEVTFAVDTEADPPVITEPEDGSSTDDTTPTIRGTAEPGATVTVSIDGDEVGTVTADGDGNWTLELTEPLAEGDHVVSAVQTDEAGNESEAAENEFAVDVTDPAPPVITDPDDGDTVDDRTPTIEGTGEPGTTIVIVVDGRPVGSVVVDEDGRWSFTLPPLSDGDHTIEAVAVDEAGNESGADSIEITVDAADGGSGGSGNDGDGPQLADTGGPALGWAIVGGALLVTGGTVLSLTRRRA